ncbi:hypothetical protein ACKAMS_26535 [Rhodococcus sp. 5A-K4]|uniref:RraA family protein n=1 Tax=Rhodococcus sp. 5A-K4 TaxID=3384442 RepID=UPI00136D8E9D|nr:hypothetical protein [Rhodococcus erythropolis]
MSTEGLVPAMLLDQTSGLLNFDALIELLAKVSPSTIGHMRDSGFAPNLQPVVRLARIVGTALTAQLPSLDSAALHYAVDMVESGYVLVITGSDSTRACLEGVVSLAAKYRGVSGMVVNGRGTDYQDGLALGVRLWIVSRTRSGPK